MRHVRETVRFADGVTTLRGLGVQAFLELGPQAVLTPLIEGGEGDQDVTAVAAARRDRPEPETLLAALAALYATGVDLDWAALLPDARRVDLPTYAFQHERYWPEPAAGAVDEGEQGTDAAFWAAVAENDLDVLADTLQVDRAPLRDVLPAMNAWRRRLAARTEVESWRYRVHWEPLLDLAAETPAGEWLLVTGEDDADPLADSLRVEGVRITPLRRVDDLVGTLAASAVAPAGVLLADPDVADVLAALRALADARADTRLWVLTHAAVATGRADPLADVEQAGLWGLGRVAALEHPSRWGGLVDLPTTTDRRAVTRLCRVLADGGEDQVAVRGSVVLGRRLVPAPLTGRAPAGPAPAGPVWRGTVLITGGTGGLGAHTARLLARSGAEQLVLLGRRGPAAPGAADLLTELTALGVRAEAVACDVTDRAALAALAARLDAEGTPVRAVVHAAGITGHRPLAETTAAEVAEANHAKVVGARHLHDVFADVELDAFLLFSSIAATWGSGGQGAYAAGNAYLDALAEHRRARGLAATSVAWGPWAGAGMAAADGAEEALRRRGLRPLEPGAALAALHASIEHGLTTTVVADVDWSVFAPGFTALRPSPLLTAVPAAEAAVAAAGVGGAPSGGAGDALRARLRGLAAADRDRAIDELVREQIALVLGHGDAAAIAPDRAFSDLGFDSLTAVELRNRLAGATGLSLPATLAFDHPNSAALARLVRTELLGAEDGPAPGTRAAEAVDLADDPVVIVAMSCRLPGGVRSPDDLWQLVADGTDAISRFPENRGWDPARLGGEQIARQGGFVYDADTFDPDFFGISPREALAMDPQQRLLLETTWELFERAGIDPTALRGSDTGVFIGAGSSGYGAALTEVPDGVAGHLLTGSASSIASGRIAYALGLEGPAVSLDTACSSSLVALHLAIQSLRRGECGLAVAGGVTVMSTPNAFLEFGRQGGLAPDGRCKAFADEADGTGWAEGVGLLLVERLSEARRRGHDVLATVRGSAINSDGASNGLTAPNGPAQQRVVRQALTGAGLTPAEVDVVEAHGTGTALGDPIEAQALLAGYGRDRDPDRPLWLGSIKSNIGHTQSAAGVAGVIKMVQAMRHGVLPRTLHADNPTTKVDWSAGTVRLLTEPVPWPETDHPRRAAVSSFGISGTNAHTILEQAPPPEPAARPAPDDRAVRPAPWLVSARGAEALRAQAARLHASLGEADPLDAARSLASGRATLEHRAAVLGRDRAELLDGLRALAEGEPAARVLTGVARPGGRSAFLFTGQGAQRAGMGRGLYAASEVFAEAFDAAAAYLDAELDRPLATLVFAEPDSPQAALLDQTGYGQPALFAYETALFRLAEAHGLGADLLVGHSIGELVAAHVAGVLSLPDACRVVAARGRLMQALPEGGAMVALQAGVDEVTPLLSTAVALAAVNGPASVVISGDEDAVSAIAAEFESRGRKARRLRVSHAFHSPRMEPMLAEFGRVLSTVDFRAPRTTVVSTVTGRPAAGGELCGPDYWVEQVRATVRFGDAVAHLDAAGVTRLLELGPDAVLTAMTAAALPPNDARACVPAARADDADEQAAFTAALAAWHVHGGGVDWTPLTRGGRRIDLPTYPFQRRRLWLDTPAPAPSTEDGPLWDAVERSDLAEVTRALGVAEDASLAEVLPALHSWRHRLHEAAVTDSWRYDVVWRHLDSPGEHHTPGSWLVIEPEDDVEYLAALTDELVRQRHDVVRLAWSAAVGDPARLVAAAADVTGVLLPATGGDTAAALPALLRALTEAGVTVPLWCLTRGAVGTGPGDPVLDPAQAMIWGLGRVAALESPRGWGGLVDLPAAPDTAVLRRLPGVLAGVAGEDQLAVRPAGVFVRRLVRATVSAADPVWSTSGTALVTGGTGALGGQVARWLARSGAEHLVLTSRRGLAAPGAAELAEELRGHGVAVTVAACDVADPEAAAALLRDLAGRGERIRTVVHAAGVSEVSPLVETSPEQFERVVAGKVAGARNLDAAFADADLDAFVLFSSIAGVWGSGGQGAYAAGNAYLDALADRRRARGLRATAVAWGPWGGGGMAAGSEAERSLQRHGLRLLAPELAVLTLRRVLAADGAGAVVADVDWSRFAPGFTGLRPSPLLGELAEVAAAVREATPDGVSSGAALRAALASAEPDERHELLVRLVREQAAVALGHRDAAALDAERAFADLGFDSLTAVEFRNALTSATGLRLSATLVYDHPTPAVLAGALLAELVPAAEPVDPAEAELRRALAATPLERFRKAGLLETLLRLAEDGAAGAEGDESPEEYDALDAAALIERALGTSATARVEG
ncbi:type I polyketide synthase [Actinoalloteichus hoggarensis]|uniref:type I polyketide synthase n=1 Tax=Actinoalloteichus hoggarensis TaxID=1470176 RepID=UPI001C8709C6|nr:SDR family NAD(P)-dependent oxidoreductase [Actinoalloteichus hoggarensis]